MEKYLNAETTRLVFATISFIAVLVIVFFIYRFIIFRIKKRVAKTPGRKDDFILHLFKIPVLWLFYWILLKIFTHIFLTDLPFYPYLLHINSLLLIFSVSWVAIQFVKAAAYYLQGKLDIKTSNNLQAREHLTKIKVFTTIASSVIVIIAISAGLLTFEQARAIGISILTSAGIIGIIIGFAAQKSIGMFLAGIQLAISQPIRIDDVVIVEGEWGRIEELTLTYVVVKIWDERRLVLPVTYFLEKPFQNWTRTSANITGSIFLYVDYSFPVESIRNVLPEMLKDKSDWDGRVANVQVTKATEQHKELRILLSSSDASKNWDLRTHIREKLIDYINSNYPDAFAKIRIKTT